MIDSQQNRAARFVLCRDSKEMFFFYNKRKAKGERLDVGDGWPAVNVKRFRPPEA